MEWSCLLLCIHFIGIISFVLIFWNYIAQTRKDRKTKQYWAPALKSFGNTYQHGSGADFPAFKQGHVPLETSLLFESEG